jgi:hypothetical protein
MIKHILLDGSSITFDTPEECSKILPLLIKSSAPVVIPAPEAIPEPEVIPARRLISFGRDGVSRIEFFEDEMQGNEHTIFFVKCMKLLMVEYRKTIVDAYRILTTENKSVPKPSGIYVLKVYRGSWGAFFKSYLYCQYDTNHTKESLRKFLVSEVNRSAHTINNMENIIANMSL